MEPIDFVNLCLQTTELKLPNKLIRLGYVKQNKEKEGIESLELTSKGKAFLNEESYVENLEWITTEYRQKFKDCNPMKFGVKSECEKKVVEIMNELNVDKEAILKAVDLYIQSLNGDYSNNMMASADYFASFMDKQGNKKSKLSQFIELISEDNNTNWLSNRV